MRELHDGSQRNSDANNGAFKFNDYINGETNSADMFQAANTKHVLPENLTNPHTDSQ